MYHPTRGGTRGGAAEFSWDAVRQDKDREHYLGHSILAPTGRWQNHKDVTWYNKQSRTEHDDGPEPAAAASAAEEARAKRREELLAVRQREEEEMNRRLGRKPDATGSSSMPALGSALLAGSSGVSSTGRGTGANTAPLDRNRNRWSSEGRADTKANDGQSSSRELGEAGLSKEERRAARKLAKLEVRERRREDRRERHAERRDREGSRHSSAKDRSRSPSPKRRRDHTDRDRRHLREYDDEYERHRRRHRSKDRSDHDRERPRREDSHSRSERDRSIKNHIDVQ